MIVDKLEEFPISKDAAKELRLELMNGRGKAVFRVRGLLARHFRLATID